MSYLVLYFLLNRASATLPGLNCRIPNDELFSAEFKVENTSEQGDSVLLTLKEGEVVDSVFRTLTRQGAVARQLNRGRLQITLHGEKGKTLGSITTKAALLILDRGFDGRYVGRLAAEEAVFEVACD